MKTSEFLRAAKAKIQDPNSWCQGAFCKEGPGLQQQYCSIGALHPVWTGSRYSELAMLAIGLLRRATNCESIAKYNDSHTHSEVMAMFDRAIELAEAEETNAAQEERLDSQVEEFIKDVLLVKPIRELESA